MDNWWTEIDGDILRRLEVNGAMAPHEIARDLGISEGEATAFLCMLAREGKVRIRLVERAGAESLLRHPAAI
jgi:DNA-binding Lrp family transcriptional regulator